MRENGRPTGRIAVLRDITLPSSSSVLSSCVVLHLLCVSVIVALFLLPSLQTLAFFIMFIRTLGYFH